MKNTIVKIGLTVVCLFSNLLIFADPGDNSDAGDLQNTDPVPINATVYILLIAGILLAVYTFRKNTKQV